MIFAESSAVRQRYRGCAIANFSNMSSFLSRERWACGQIAAAPARKIASISDVAFVRRRLLRASRSSELVCLWHREEIRKKPRVCCLSKDDEDVELVVVAARRAEVGIDAEQMPAYLAPKRTVPATVSLPSIVYRHRVRRLHLVEINNSRLVFFICTSCPRPLRDLLSRGALITHQAATCRRTRRSRARRGTSSAACPGRERREEGDGRRRRAEPRRPREFCTSAVWSQWSAVHPRVKICRVIC